MYDKEQNLRFGQQDTSNYDDFSVNPADFDTYNDYAAAKVEELPDHLVILLPTPGGQETLLAVQVIWLNDFLSDKKKLFA